MKSTIIDINVPNPNRFFDGSTPADKLIELKNLIAEAKTIIDEGKQVFLSVEQLITDFKALLGK